ncbi:hypothetical protein [Bacillus sp. 37MA]|uniref:hypothetical protein n=1 Tax=Bacillus sp. 37MA TaxID=1132442 RepID=UPI00035C58AB|nr:hypothetical protein [Bacillus sp. 37MA]
MKNKLGLSLLFLLLSFVLAACSEEATPEKETAVETKEEPAATKTSSENKTILNETGTFTQIKKSMSVDPVTSGPFTVSLPLVSTVSGKLAGEAATYYGTNNLQFVQVEMDIAHSTEATDNLWLSFVKIVTNTGEQLDPDITLSNMISGDFYGKVNHTGSYVYVLQNSQPEDIEWIRVLIDPPHDENNNEIGESFDIHVDFQ